MFNRNRGKLIRQVVVSVYEDDLGTSYDYTTIDGKPLSARDAREVLRASLKPVPMPTYVYWGTPWGVASGRQNKIGITTDLNRRASELRINIRGSVWCSTGDEARYIEQKLLKMFKMLKKHSHGEWLDIHDGGVEYLKIVFQYPADQMRDLVDRSYRMMCDGTVDLRAAIEETSKPERFAWKRPAEENKDQQ